MKITRPCYHHTPLEHREFPQNKKLCVAHCLKEKIIRESIDIED